MRKKYLSALLFGALLLASAGTFTSCKDYDDDIKNLQEQINTVKTSLDELTTKVNNLGAGITDFKYENGQLVIVTDKDTNFTVDMPECEGIVKLEIKDGVLYADGVAVGNVSGDGGSVVEVKDGVIYVDGKAAGELGNKVAIVDNGDGTYTLTVDGKNYVLPKASNSVMVELEEEGINGYFTNYTFDSSIDKNKGGIVWGKSTTDKWGGLKPVAKDGLLVGMVNTAKVTVMPAGFDLSSAKLTLVNTLGQSAPVVVTPVAASDDLATTGSRAASANGEWNLQIAMDETVTLDNIATAFTNNAEENPENLCYALAVDGKVVTPYKFVIDTQEKSLNETNGAIADFSNLQVNFDGNAVNSNTKLSLGEATLSLSDISSIMAGDVKDLDKVYDSYIELTNKDFAESHEISVSGMTIKSTDKAAAAEGLIFKVHVLDVTGKEVVSDEFKVGFASSTVEGEVIADQTLTLIPNKSYVLVDLGNTFTTLTADQAEAISKADSWQNQPVEWVFAKDAATFNETGVNVAYYASKEDAAEGKNEIIVTEGSTSTIRTIKYARIETAAFKSNAEAGANKVTITLRDNKQNEVKKVSATVTIALPKFDDVVAANTEYTLWDGDTFTTRMKYTDADANGVLPINNAFISKKDAAGANYLDVAYMNYAVSYKDANGNDVTVNTANLADLKNDKGGLKANEFAAKASIEVVAGQSKLAVSKDFTVKLMTLFEGGKIVYYVNNAAVDVASLPSDRILKAGSVDDKGVKNGLFVTIDKYEVAFKAISTEIGGYTVVSATGTPSATTTINYVIGKKEGSAGTPAVATGGENIVVSGISAGESGEMIFTYTDKGGIKTSSSLKYKM